MSDRETDHCTAVAAELFLDIRRLVLSDDVEKTNIARMHTANAFEQQRARARNDGFEKCSEERAAWQQSNRELSAAHQEALNELARSEKKITRLVEAASRVSFEWGETPADLADCDETFVAAWQKDFRKYVHELRAAIAEARK